MKRDPELIRTLLKMVEAASPGTYLKNEYVKIDGFSDREIAYHVELLEEAGLIKAKLMKTMQGPVFFVIERLTWEGHEFFEASQHDEAWNTVKKMMSASGGFVMEVAKPLLVDIIKRQLLSGL